MPDTLGQVETARNLEVSFNRNILQQIPLILLLTENYDKDIFYVNDSFLLIIDIYGREGSAGRSTRKIYRRINII